MYPEGRLGSSCSPIASLFALSCLYVRFSPSLRPSKFLTSDCESVGLQAIQKNEKSYGESPTRLANCSHVGVVFRVVRGVVYHPDSIISMG